MAAVVTGRTNAYISIGNSDDKLTQQRWAQFIAQMRDFVTGNAGVMPGRFWQVHGEWYSRPDHPWQNANWCVEINTADVDYLRGQLAAMAAIYEQDSIALVVGNPEFVEADKWLMGRTA